MYCVFVTAFFFNDTATTEIYTLSLHDALPISASRHRRAWPRPGRADPARGRIRSEEHTSELQSRQYLVCRLLLEKKKVDHAAIDWGTVVARRAQKNPQGQGGWTIYHTGTYGVD